MLNNHKVPEPRDTRSARNNCRNAKWMQRQAKQQQDNNAAVFSSSVELLFNTQKCLCGKKHILMKTLIWITLTWNIYTLWHLQIPLCFSASHADNDLISCDNWSVIGSCGSAGICFPFRGGSCWSGGRGSAVLSCFGKSRLNEAENDVNQPLPH